MHSLYRKKLRNFDNILEKERSDRFSTKSWVKLRMQSEHSFTDQTGYDCYLWPSSTSQTIPVNTPVLLLNEVALCGVSSFGGPFGYPRSNSSLPSEAGTHSRVRLFVFLFFGGISSSVLYPLLENADADKWHVQFLDIPDCTPRVPTVLVFGLCPAVIHATSHPSRVIYIYMLSRL